jgi:hypothetical protein
MKCALRGLATALVAIVCTGCLVDVKYDDVRLACSDGVCPMGMECVQGICFNPAEIPDAAVDSASDAPVDALALASCDESFSGAPGYELCTEEPLQCSFNVQLSGSTCTAACTELGTTCLTSYDNETVRCDPIAEESCDVSRNSQICVCAKIPPP